MAVQGMAVEEVNQEGDGKIRVVKVKTAKSLFKRCISKLSILPMEDNVNN